MTDESQQLRSITKWRTKPGRAVKLGDTVKQLMENRISPQQVRFGQVAELWSRLLPAELHQHCRIDGISSGVLKVLVDSPSYVYELRLCSSELLGELQRQCPRAQIKNIKFVVG